MTANRPDAIYAIGDIHGLPGQLRQVLIEIKRDAESLGISKPRVVFLGDYCDRGTQTKDVLDILTSPEIQTEFDPIFLRGNHDHAFERIVRTADEKLASEWGQLWGGFETVDSYGIDMTKENLTSALAKLQKAVPRAHREFLENLKMSFETEGCFFSHAGVDPGLPLDQQPEQILMYGTQDMFKPLLWSADIQKLVIHGHNAEKELVITERRVGIDTGCGYAGGFLSAVRLDGRDIKWTYPDPNFFTYFGYPDFGVDRPLFGRSTHD